MNSMNSKPIIYQVMNRLFGNTTENNQINGTLAENGSGKFASFTAKAIREIKALGCTHIWYTGIIEHATCTDYSAFNIAKNNPNVVKGIAGSPYAIKDYYDVNPDLAKDVNNRMNEFENLVKRTHKEGMHLIIDFVPNHLAREYKSDAKPATISDFGEKDNTQLHFDPQNNFYHIPSDDFSPQIPLKFPDHPYVESPSKATGNDCFHAYPNTNDWYETVKLNYGIDYTGTKHGHYNPTPDTWLKMKDILIYWAKKGVDGFRCDMAEMVPIEFWSWVIPAVKDQFPSILFIAETYNPNEYHNFIFTGKFDYLYDKVGLYDTLKAVSQGNAQASAITGSWQSLGGIDAHILNFLENHDEQRIASDFFLGDSTKAIPALIVSATINTGAFMLYFGQELGEKGMDYEGFSGRDGRTTIFDYWNPTTINNWYNGGKCSLTKLTSEQIELRKNYNRVLMLCNEEAAISNGLFYDLMYVNDQNEHFNPQKQYAYIRKYENELILVVVNFDDREVDLKINIPTHAFEYLNMPDGALQHFTDLYSGNTLTNIFSYNTPMDVKVKKHSGVIFKCILVELS